MADSAGVGGVRVRESAIEFVQFLPETGLTGGRD